MKKVIAIVLSLVAITGIGFLLTINSEDSITEAELREKFRCDNRVTLAEYATDIYCLNPERYYEDVRNGTVIEML